MSALGMRSKGSTEFKRIQQRAAITTSYSGSVTVRCPYNDNGTFGVVGTATYLCYQNFSKYSYNLKTDLETYSFNKKIAVLFPATWAAAGAAFSTAEINLS